MAKSFKIKRRRVPLLNTPGGDGRSLRSIINRFKRFIKWPNEVICSVGCSVLVSKSIKKVF